MTCAYDEMYVDDAACNLGEFMDFMVRTLGYDSNRAFSMFAGSNTGKMFERGNPAYVTGISGTELAEKLLYELKGTWLSNAESVPIERSYEYWAGWAIAQYQWRKNTGFSQIIRFGLDMKTIESMYVLHEADVTKFIEAADIIYEKNRKEAESTLKRLRKYYELTQKELSEKSGVSLRMIQLYEQGQNDISKAQSNVVKALADTLGCDMAELIR